MKVQRYELFPIWKKKSAGGTPQHSLDSANRPAAEVAAVADEAGIVDAGADTEAVDVDAVAVPVGGHADLGAFLDTEDRLREDAGLGLGAVDEDIGFVGGVGADDGGVVADGDVDLEGIGGGDGTELNLGEVALGDDEVLVVDGGGTRSVGVDAVPVHLDEDVAFGGAAAASHLEEAQADGREEGTGQAVDGTEAGADELLRLAVTVVHLALVGAHHRFAFPKRTHNGSYFSNESVKDSPTNFCHNFKCFKR